MGQGTAEADWLDWLSRQSIPRLHVQQLFADKQRLVVVAPHPDDEILACGGLLVLAAKASFPIKVVAVTDGEASHGLTNDCQRRSLRQQRVRERLAGLEQLGIEAACVVRLKIPDGAVAQNTDLIFGQLHGLLQPRDLVVTTWFKDGHPDHEATACAVRRTRCQCIEAPVWMWHWAQPADTCIPWLNLMAVELTDSAIDAKQNALAQHYSQLEPRSSQLEPVLMPSIIERAARQHEYFFMGDSFR